MSPNYSLRKLHTKAVKMAAENLMLTSGATSTLEVKNQLRKQGYLAFQSEVSDCMDRIAAEQGWCYVFNGFFRIYFFPEEMQASQAAGLPAFSLN